jgi:hypothetical protein
MIAVVGVVLCNCDEAEAEGGMPLRAGWGLMRDKLEARGSGSEEGKSVSSTEAKDIRGCGDEGEEFDA